MTTSNPQINSYVVKDEEELPPALQKMKAAFALKDVDAVLDRPIKEICGSDGRVIMAGAIEFVGKITPDELTDYCDPNELYSPDMATTRRFRTVYDPEIQRGVKEAKSGPKEFLRESQIASMMEDIETKQFNCPSLNWNLRSGKTSWAYLTDSRELRVYQGVATRPDSNHRHHAIVRFHLKYRDWVTKTQSLDFNGYQPERHYAITIYTDDFEGEAHRFFVYNFKGWKVSPSTAHFIESKTHNPMIHSKLARVLMEKSAVLGNGNVELLSNTISKNSVKMLTFGTLTEALRTAFPGVTETDFDEVVDFLMAFLEKLKSVRPLEINTLSLAQRQKARREMFTDQATMFHAFFRVAAWLRDNHSSDWEECLERLNAKITVELVDSAGQRSEWKGDVFDRMSPLWLAHGVAQLSKKGEVRVSNTRQTRQAAYDVIKEVVEGHARLVAPTLPPATPIASAAA
jgi:hypothetical protein